MAARLASLAIRSAMIQWATIALMTHRLAHHHT
jgi:hypothetical protein